jgi:DNA-binding MarR family transcriptional regulator
MSSLAEHAALVPDDAGFFPIFTSSNLGRSDLRASRSPILNYRTILLTRTTNFVNTIGRRPGQGYPMSDAKHATKRAMLLRKTPQKRRSAPVIDLGVLNERLGYFIRRAQLWVFQDFIRRLSSLDLSPAEFSVLVVIGTNTGLSQAELAMTLGIERARLVRLLHRLERRGLTQRLPSSADGRRHALRLTADGQKILARAKMLAAQHEAALKEKLGAERHRLLLESLRAF